MFEEITENLIGNWITGKIEYIYMYIYKGFEPPNKTCSRNCVINCYGGPGLKSHRTDDANGIHNSLLKCTGMCFMEFHIQR